MKLITSLYISMVFAVLFFLHSFSANAQDDSWKSLDSLEEDEFPGLASATFKGTRLINFQTIEVDGKRTLDFRISHRFGEISSGSYNLYGIDGPANIRLGLEYSYDGRLMAGIGRSSYQKQFDGFLKYRLLRQTDTNKMPVSVTLYTSVFMTSLKDPNKSTIGFDKYDPIYNRLSFAHQIIVGRKFTPSFSLQIAPVMVHYNMVEEFTDLNDMFFITVAARMKITQRLALTAEYGYSLKDYSISDNYYNPLGIGIDIETGGHVFQVHVTNAFGVTENQFLPYNTSSWKDSDMRIGFNISRVFTL